MASERRTEEARSTFTPYFYLIFPVRKLSSRMNFMKAVFLEGRLGRLAERRARGVILVRLKLRALST